MPEIASAEYDVPRIVSYFHLKSPRFLHNDDAALLVSRSDTERSNYIFGTLFGSLLILTIFSIWCTILMVVKIMKYLELTCDIRRMNSDHDDESTYDTETMDPAERHASSEEEGFFVKSSQSYKRRNVSKCFRPSKKIMSLRIIFLSSSAIVFSTTLFLVAGISSLRSSFDILDDGFLKVSQLAANGKNATSQAIKLSQNSIPLRDYILYTLDEESHCLDTNETIYGSALVMKQNLNLLGEKFFVPTFESFITEMTAIQSFAEMMRDNLQNYSWWFWSIMCLLVLVNAITVTFVVGVALAWKGVLSYRFESIQSFVLMPLFFLTAAFNWGAASGLSMALVVNADFCYGNNTSPDETIRKMVMKQGGGSFLYDIVDFYVGGCMIKSPVNFIHVFSSSIESTLSQITTFLLHLPEETPVEFLCERAYVSLSRETQNLHSKLRILANKLRVMANIIRCEKVSHMYKNVVHVTTCHEGSRGLFWVFVCAVVVSVSCMIMISIRISWWDELYYYFEKTYEHSENVISTSEVADGKIDIVISNGRKEYDCRESERGNGMEAVLRRK